MNIRINFKSKVQNFIHLPIKLHINNHIQKTYTTTINWPQTNIHKKRPHTHTKTELYPVKKHENRGPPVHIFHVCFFLSCRRRAKWSRYRKWPAQVLRDVVRKKNYLRRPWGC